MKPIRSCPKCKGEMELGRIYPMLLMFLRRQRITERIWLRLMPPPKFPFAELQIRSERYMKLCSHLKRNI
jgi:hypothetical protein